VSVLAFGTRVRGFKTRPNPSDFSGEKILSAPTFGGDVQPSVPCRKFTACKRTQKWRGSRHFRQNSRKFLAHSSTFRYWGSLASFQTLGTPCGESWDVLNHWSSRLGGLTCRWQWHSVKTFLLRILNDSWAGQNLQGLQSRLKKKKKNLSYEGWNFNSGNYLFTTDTK